MDITRLSELKEKLAIATNFGDLWEFYMDEFADHPEFLDWGEQVYDSFLEKLIPKVCKEIFGRRMTISGTLIIYIPEYKFFHSPFYADHNIGGFFYFSDVHQGLLAASKHFPPTADCLFSRFTDLPLPKNPKGFQR